jgi:hypothetical protein
MQRGVGSSFFINDNQQQNKRVTNETYSLVRLKSNNTKSRSHKQQVGKGCLNMIPNQRQRYTAASDWEPYQANKEIEYIDCPP